MSSAGALCVRQSASLSTSTSNLSGIESISKNIRKQIRYAILPVALTLCPLATWFKRSAHDEFQCNWRPKRIGLSHCAQDRSSGPQRRSGQRHRRFLADTVILHFPLPSLPALPYHRISLASNAVHLLFPIMTGFVNDGFKMRGKALEDDPLCARQTRLQHVSVWSALPRRSLLKDR